MPKAKIKVAVVCFAIVFSAAALAWWCGEDPAQEMAKHKMWTPEQYWHAYCSRTPSDSKCPAILARPIADEFQSFDEPLGQHQGDDGHQTHTGGDATKNCFVVLPKAAAQIVKTATVAIGDYPKKGDAFIGICEVIER
jgi:hypothetical protein